MFEYKLQPELNMNEVFQLMQEFKCDFINHFCEIIIDESTNTYINIHKCKSLDDVKATLLMGLCRPIGKGLYEKDANRLLGRFNSYFNTNLTRRDMRKIYAELCYESKFDENKDFVKRGFPVHELEENEYI